MLVTKSNFSDILLRLENSYNEPKSLDTETTGLHAYHGDKLFSIIISTGEKLGTYYFNFQKYEDIPEEHILPREHLQKFAPLFKYQSLWFLHNAPFDMHMLAQEGLELSGEIHDTQVIGRIIRNNQDYGDGYSLDALAKEIGKHKDDAVMQYIKEHGLSEKKEIFGKEVTQLFFDKVPWKIIVPYGIQDALVTHELACWQIKQVEKLSSDESRITPYGNLKSIMRNERQLSKVCFQMERTGIKIDRGFCIRAANYEAGVSEAKKIEFKQITGRPFVDSRATFAPIFDKFSLKYPLTEKGNPSFKAEVLETLKHPIAKIITDIREASKKENTYYRNFVRFADTESVIRAQMKQAGTETGRFSYAQPNLQNLSKEKDTSKEFVIRRSFVPRKDFCFVMVDFEQMEYRLMLDYAGETNLIEKISQGFDVHQATADSMSKISATTRDQAKTLNFMLLYGGGPVKIALELFTPTLPEYHLQKIYQYCVIAKPRLRVSFEAMTKELGISPQEFQHNYTEIMRGRKLRETYFSGLPAVAAFIKDVQNVAQRRGFIKTWAGSILLYDNPRFAYKAPNGLIQGGCAQIVKIAMVRCQELLKGMKSRMLVQVHDELLFEIHKDELSLVPKLRNVMSSVYPFKRLPMSCSVDHSWKSWGDKVKGMPSGQISFV